MQAQLQLKAYSLHHRGGVVLALLVAVLLGTGLAGCSAPPVGPDDNSNSGEPPNELASDCIGCHTDEALLKLVAREEPPPAEEAGEG
jgi:hypothetical protein